MQNSTEVDEFQKLVTWLTQISAKLNHRFLSHCRSGGGGLRLNSCSSKPYWTERSVYWIFFKFVFPSKYAVLKLNKMLFVNVCMFYYLTKLWSMWVGIIRGMVWILGGMVMGLEFTLHSIWIYVVLWFDYPWGVYGCGAYIPIFYVGIINEWKPPNSSKMWKSSLPPPNYLLVVFTTRGSVYYLLGIKTLHNFVTS